MQATDFDAAAQEWRLSFILHTEGGTCICGQRRETTNRFFLQNVHNDSLYAEVGCCCISRFASKEEVQAVGYDHGLDSVSHAPHLMALVSRPLFHYLKSVHSGRQLGFTSSDLRFYEDLFDRADALKCAVPSSSSVSTSSASSSKPAGSSDGAWLRKLLDKLDPDQRLWLSDLNQRILDLFHRTVNMFPPCPNAPARSLRARDVLRHHMLRLPERLEEVRMSDATTRSRPVSCMYECDVCGAASRVSELQWEQGSSSRQFLRNIIEERTGDSQDGYGAGGGVHANDDGMQGYQADGFVQSDDEEIEYEQPKRRKRQRSRSPSAQQRSGATQRRPRQRRHEAAGGGSLGADAASTDADDGDDWGEQALESRPSAYEDETYSPAEGQTLHSPHAIMASRLIHQPRHPCETQTMIGRAGSGTRVHERWHQTSAEGLAATYASHGASSTKAYAESSDVPRGAIYPTDVCDGEIDIRSIKAETMAGLTSPRSKAAARRSASQQQDHARLEHRFEREHASLKTTEQLQIIKDMARHKHPEEHPRHCLLKRHADDHEVDGSPAGDQTAAGSSTTSTVTSAELRGQRAAEAAPGSNRSSVHVCPHHAVIDEQE